MRRVAHRIVRTNPVFLPVLITAMIVVGLALYGGPPVVPTATTEPAVSTTPAVEKEVAGWRPAVNPKPLSGHVRKGLAWLVEHQHKNGGWSQGEESAHMGRSMQNLTDTYVTGTSGCTVYSAQPAGGF